jgi:hypothetical protein
VNVRFKEFESLALRILESSALVNTESIESWA